VHVYVNGVFRAALAANVNRPDVGAAYPAYGANHGFSSTGAIAGTAGNTVCAYGINVGPGSNALLGCKTV